MEHKIVKSEYLVKSPFASIMMLVYNHEKFVEQAIRSLVSQTCNFEFEIVIGEDCSNDRSREICLEFQKEFPTKIVLLLHSQNVGLLCNYHEVINQCRGKYILGCAGDDYWIDDFKVQNQVSFLENNSEYALVHTGFYQILENDSNLIENRISLTECDNNFEDLLFGNKVAGLTKCYPREVYFEYFNEIRPHERGWLIEDYPFWLWLSINYKIRYFPELTAVYRIRKDSISHQVDPIKIALYNMTIASIREFFALKESKIDLIKENLGELYTEILDIFYQNSYFKYKELVGSKINFYTKSNFKNQFKSWGISGGNKYLLSKLAIEAFRFIKKAF